MSNPLKVMCFLFDPNIGGPTIRARSVYERMIPDGYDVRVVFPKDEGTAVGYMAEKNVPTDKLQIAKPVLPRKVFAFLRFALSAPIAIFRIAKYLRTQKPDVIHVNGAFDILPALGGRLAGVPVVWHLNDTVFGARLSGILGRVVTLVSHTIIVAATRVGEHYGVLGANPHVIFAPVDVERFAKRPPDAFPAAQPVLTLIGNWNWIKGHDRFIDVLAGLDDRGVKVSGLAVGRFLEGQKDYWAPILERAKALGNALDAPGFVADTPAVLNRSDILLVTSHSEASPMSLLEAMSVGVPVVSFDVGGVKEMLGDGDAAAGIVVAQGDVMAMTDAVVTLLQDPHGYRKMALNGQKRARDYFSLEACVDRHQAAYAAAVHSKDKVKI